MRTMKLNVLAPCALLCLAVGCASTPSERAPQESQPEVQREWVAAVPATLPAQSSAETPTTDEARESAIVMEEPAEHPVEGQAQPTSLATRVQLELWNDPQFQRQFAQSYMAESEVEPTVSLDEREAMQKVLEYISKEEMQKALKLLKEENSPSASAVLDFTIANIHFQLDELEPAAAAYRAAVGKYPKISRAWKNLWLIYVRLGEFGAAAPAFTEVLQLGGGDAITYGLLGFCYTSLDKQIGAESAYRMAAMLDPETMDWKMGLARTFFKQRRFAEASAICETLIQENPERPDLWLLQANAFIGLGEPLRAAENFELVNSLGHASRDSLNTLGDIYINEELYDLAFDSYFRALELDESGDGQRALRAAKVLTARGALEEAGKLIARIEELCGERLDEAQRKDVLKLQARLAVAQGAGEEEVRVLQQIVEIDPLDGEALLLLGQHAERTGDNEGAIFYYERAQSLEAFEPDACVRHAQLLVRTGEYQQALPLLRRAQTLKPRDHVQSFLEQVEQRVPKGR